MKIYRFVTVFIIIIFSILNFLLIINDTHSLKAIDSTDLIGHWTFNEGSGSKIFDTSGKEYHGNIHGASWTRGVNGSGLSFNGEDNYIEIPNNDDLNGITEFTISIWFKVDYFDIWEPLVNKGYTNEGFTDVFEINIDQGGYVSFVLNFDTMGRQTYSTSPGTIIAGTWHHLVGSYDGDFLRIYIDSELVSEHDVYNEPLKTSDASLYIGVEYEYPDESYFNGAIDEITLFARYIESDEVFELYTQKAIKPLIKNNLKINHGAERSPLIAILPKQAIPVVATITSVIFIILWQLFGNLIMEFLSDYTSEKIIDIKATKKNFSEKLDKIKIPYISMKTSDIVNLGIAVFVFSAAMSWTWSDGLEDILGLFILNFFVVGFIFTLREAYRIYYSNKNKIETKHIIWPFGSILTILSTFIGNTFSLASYVTADNEEDNRYAQMLYQSTIIFYMVSLVAFSLNFIKPNVVLQMIFVFCIMTVMIDMTPIKPMDGDIIRKWNTKYWLILYSIIGVSYLIMIFNLY